MQSSPFTDAAAQSDESRLLPVLRLYETFLSHTPDLAYVFDLDHRFIYANEALLKMWGRPREDAIGKNCLELGYEPWHAAMHDREIEQVKATRLPIRGEVPFDGTNGRRIYDYIFVPVLGPNGEVEAVAGTTRDVTERKATEVALRQSEAHLASMFEQTVVGILEVGLDGKVLRGNARFCEMLLLSREELAGKSVNELTHPADLAATLHNLATLVATGKPFVVQKRYLRQDGSYMWASSSVSLIRGDDGRGASMLAVIQDISELKQREAELEEASRRKDEFLAMLAHELRNPLAPISAAAELLALPQLDQADALRACAIIGRQVRHMTSLVDDLLDVSRVTRGLVTLKQAELDLRSIVADAVEQARPLIDACSHTLQLNLPQQEARVVGDAKRLVQVLANLLNNAAKYTPHGGRIELSLDLLPEEVRLCVKDNGVGMSADITGRVFDLFVQAERSNDRSQGGLGLGLALVKSLVALHHGRVEAKSPGPGQGSEFILWLPRVVQTSLAFGPESVADARKARSLNLLVVDDNVDAARMLAMLLEADGHTVRVEHDAKGTLARVHEERPDACLLDLGMPGMDGFQLARALRALRGMEGSKLVAVTGYGGEQERQASAAAGFHHHLVKPVDSRDLAALLDRIAREQKGEAL